MKKSIQWSLVGAAIFSLYIISCAKHETISQFDQKLALMVQDELDRLHTALEFAQKSHENFMKEDEADVARSAAGDDDKILLAELRINRQTRDLLDAGNRRAIDVLMNLQKELNKSDFYVKNKPIVSKIEIQKKELIEKVNGRIYRMESSYSMITDRVKNLEKEIQQLHDMRRSKEISNSEKQAIDMLIKIIKEHKKELKNHAQTIKETIKILQAHKNELKKA